MELRSLTFGVGSYSAEFERLQEVVGKAADRAVEIRRDMLAVQ